MHMRASLERNSCQSKFPGVYAEPSFNSRIRNKDMGNFQAHNLKKTCTKRQFKGIHDRFLRDHVFSERMIENKRDEDACRAWDILQNEITRIECQNQNTFTTSKIGGPLSSMETTANQ